MEGKAGWPLNRQGKWSHNCFMLIRQKYFSQAVELKAVMRPYGQQYRTWVAGILSVHPWNIMQPCILLCITRKGAKLRFIYSVFYQMVIWTLISWTAC